MYLLALLEQETPAAKITVVPGEHENIEGLPLKLPPDAVVTLLCCPTAEYPLKNGKTTFYVCKDNRCLPPVNDLNGILHDTKDLRGD